MRRPRLLIAALAAPLLAATVPGVPVASAAPELSGAQTEFSVLAEDGRSAASAADAVRAAGGTVVRTNEAIGLITATAPAEGFIERVSATDAVSGAAKAQPIGHAPANRKAPAPDVVEKENTFKQGKGNAAPDAPVGLDPLDEKLWGLKSVRSDLARTEQPGDKRVKVGVIDTGVDANHPDIAPNFDAADSRNFTRDIPADENGNEVDGPCEFRGCVDPIGHDDGGHGSHVAGTIGAAANGFGLSGVAPNVSLVNVRAGQDSGNFFLQPVVDAITYSGDARLDVTNMSFYVDPWLYNCASNAADSPERQLEQRTITKAVNRALKYAHDRGVTQVVSLGNQHTDLGTPQPDASSPNFPVETAYPRTIDNGDCVSLPVEGPNTIGVSAFGPSQAKADYSNFGTEQISIAAPGGYFRDGFGTDWFQANENMILSTYPKNVAIAEGMVDEAGEVTPEGVEAGVQKQTAPDGRVGYYQYLQGTSMASPHATGVAAVIASEFGKVRKGEFGMDPDAVQRVLEGTAAPIACPVPRTVDYLDEGRDETFTATCEGPAEFNGFYGHGAVDAYSAIKHGREFVRG